MSTRTRAPATRSTLLRHRRRLGQVQRGTQLLRRRRQALVNELLSRAHAAVQSREALDAEARQAWQALWMALASQSRAGLTPLGWPTREVQVDLTVVDLWGVTVVQLGESPRVARSLAARGVLPGPDEAGSQEAAGRFEALVERLLAVAPEEHVMRRLGQALARTTRLVNTLEQRVATGLERDITAIEGTLDEREREEHLRIKRLIGRRR